MPRHPPLFALLYNTTGIKALNRKAQQRHDHAEALRILAHDQLARAKQHADDPADRLRTPNDDAQASH